MNNELNKVIDEIMNKPAPKGFAPFTPEELKEVKMAWKEDYFKKHLTGNVEKDLRIISEYGD